MIREICPTNALTALGLIATNTFIGNISNITNPLKNFFSGYFIIYLISLSLTLLLIFIASFRPEPTARR